MKLSFINKKDCSVNLKDFLQKENGVSARLITKLKRQHLGITCGGELIRTIDDVPPGAEVVLNISDENEIVPNGALDVPVIYEDEHVVVFSKPQGMPVHPSMNHYTDTLGNFFSWMYPDITFRPVNRLDRNTSGLCVAAKNQHSAALLQRSVEKTYYALICGTPYRLSGTIDAPIKRQTESMITRCVAPDGQRAVTHYTVLSSCGKYSWVRVKLETGRTHQIRVHFSYIGHALAGDDMYGGSLEHIQRQALHCGKMEFTEPVTNENLKITIPISSDILNLFK